MAPNRLYLSLCNWCNDKKLLVKWLDLIQKLFTPAQLRHKMSSIRSPISEQWRNCRECQAQGETHVVLSSINIREVPSHSRHKSSLLSPLPSGSGVFLFMKWIKTEKENLSAQVINVAFLAGIRIVNTVVKGWKYHTLFSYSLIRKRTNPNIY